MFPSTHLQMDLLFPFFSAVSLSLHSFQVACHYHLIYFCYWILYINFAPCTHTPRHNEIEETRDLERAMSEESERLGE